MNVAPKFTVNTCTLLPPLIVITPPPSIVVLALMVLVLVTVIVAGPPQVNVTAPPPESAVLRCVSSHVVTTPAAHAGEGTVSTASASVVRTVTMVHVPLLRSSRLSPLGRLPRAPAGKHEVQTLLGSPCRVNSQRDRAPCACHQPPSREPRTAMA